MRRSADGIGDLNGAVGSASFLRLKGALCVSLMIITLVLIVEGMLSCADGDGLRKRVASILSGEGCEHGSTSLVL